MGTGKTSYAIQKMNEDADGRYIYITPYLSEVQRIKEQCENKRFYEPVNKGGGKLDNLHKLLREGKNIASTHALFRNYNDITKELINIGGYTLILDEVVDVVEQLKLQKDDLPTILESGFAEVRDNFLVWIKDDYQGEYNFVRDIAKNGNLVVVNNIVLMWTFPIDIFKSFKEVYVLSYLFHAQIQKYYYDFYNMKYEYYDVKNKDGRYYLVEKQEGIDTSDKSNIAKNINILQDDKLNSIGNNYYNLSSTWFSKPENKDFLVILKNNLYNYFCNKTKAKSKQIMWTTFKNYKSKLKGKGYTKSFAPVNARATNKYVDRNIVAYCVNVFLNPLIKQFFLGNGIKVNEDDYALSEMLQFIWRSAIRVNKPITIYIPSSRMRELLEHWMGDR